MSGIITKLDGTSFQLDNVEILNSPTDVNFSSTYFTLSVSGNVLTITPVKRPTVFSWLNTQTLTPTTYYHTINNYLNATSLDLARSYVGAGTFRNFRVGLLTGAGVDTSVTLTWLKNQTTVTGLTTTIALTPSTWLTGTDLTHSFTTIATDYVCLRVVLSTGLNIQRISYYVEFVPD